MLVNDSLLINIRSLLNGLLATPSNEQGVFLVKNRKKLKILVETISEQLIESYFDKKPKNIPTARLLINTNMKTLSNEDDCVLFESLREVLNLYDILGDKTYIDHKPRLEPLFRKEIRLLFLNMALHNKLADNIHARAVRSLLHGS